MAVLEACSARHPSTADNAHTARVEAKTGSVCNKDSPQRVAGSGKWRPAGDDGEGCSRPVTGYAS